LVHAVVSVEFQKWIYARPRLRAAVGFVGGLTLEVYLVHAFLAHWEGLAKLCFPVNLVFFFAGTLFLSWGFFHLAGQVRGVLEKRMLRSSAKVGDA
jgi:hypothetical protein